MTRNTKLLIASCSLALLIGTQGGCAGPSKVAKAPVPGTGIEKLSGKVVETVDSGGYTYILLEKDGKKTWAAIPTTKVKVGDELKLIPGAEMIDFGSKSLNRTFDRIIFSGGLDNGAAAAPHAAPVKITAKNDPYEKPVMAGKLVETMDSGGYTYLCLEKDGKKGWSAVPTTPVKLGDDIELTPGIDMVNFSSNSLKRTFVNIHFSAGIKGVDAAGPAAATEPAALPANHPPLQPQQMAAKGTDRAAAAVAPPISGKVVETMNSGGYSYICLEKDGAKTWVAAPAMKTALGEQLSFQPGAEMPNFNSKSLNRSFEKIIFSNGPTGK